MEEATTTTPGTHEERQTHEFERKPGRPLPKVPGEPGQCPRCDEAACICEWERCAKCAQPRDAACHRAGTTPPIIEAERCPFCRERIAATEVHLATPRDGCRPIMGLAVPPPTTTAGQTGEGAVEMRLCESRFLALRPGQLYRFTIDATCPNCLACASAYEGEPTALNPPDTAAERGADYWRRECFKVEAERDALRAEMAETRMARDAALALRRDAMRRLGEAESDRDRLAARVAELEAELRGWRHGSITQ